MKTPLSSALLRAAKAAEQEAARVKGAEASRYARLADFLRAESRATERSAK